MQKGLSVIASHFVADDGLCDRLYKTGLLKKKKTLDEILSKFTVNALREGTKYW